MSDGKKDDSLVRQAPAPMAIYDPNLAAGDEAGLEGMTSNDIKLPFLALAQKTSKVLDRSEGKYIKGLEFGEIYNSETGEIYGGCKDLDQKPIEFLPVMLGKRARLLDANNLLGETVAWDDPRVIPPWEPGSPNKTVEDCEGVRIYDWAILLLPSLDQIIVSFKSTSFSAGKSLNTILDKYRKLARIAGKGFRPYQVKLAISTFVDKNESGSFGKFKIELAGSPTEGEYRFADAWFQSIDGKNLVTEDEGAADSGGAGDAVEGEVVQTKSPSDVPF